MNTLSSRMSFCPRPFVKLGTYDFSESELDFESWHEEFQASVEYLIQSNFADAEYLLA